MKITKEKVIEIMAITKLVTGSVPTPVEVQIAFDHAQGMYEEIVERKNT